MRIFPSYDDVVIDPGVRRETRVPSRPPAASRSELQAALTGGVSQHGYSPMIPISTPVERDGMNTFDFGSLGQELADLRRSRFVAAVRNGVSDFGFHCPGGNQGHAKVVVHELSVNMLGTAEDGEARALCRSMQSSTNPQLTTAASY